MQEMVKIVAQVGPFGQHTRGGVNDNRAAALFARIGKKAMS